MKPVIALIALLFAACLVGCSAPPEVGQIAQAAQDTAPVLDAQADAFEAQGKLAKAAQFREWSATLRTVSAKINVMIEDGIIDEADAYEAIAPYLDDGERLVLDAALALTGDIVRGEAGVDSVLAAAQIALPVIIPGYGVLIAGLAGVLRGFFRQRKATDAIVRGVETLDLSEMLDADKATIREAMGDFARAAVKKSKKRNAIRAAAA